MLNLPLDRTLRPRGGSRPAADAGADGSQPLAKQPALILAVDDEADALDFLYTLLTSEGFDFVKAASGAEALALIEQRRPDLVIVDVMMPGMTGLELCDLLRSDISLRDIPIILYSGYRMQEHSNADMYDLAFLKPAEPDDLLSAIRSLLPE